MENRIDCIDALTQSFSQSVHLSVLLLAHLSYDVRLEVKGRLSELFCVVLCTEAVHSHKHT